MLVFLALCVLLFVRSRGSENNDYSRINDSIDRSNDASLNN